jgi:hypothetical protein
MGSAAAASRACSLSCSDMPTPGLPSSSSLLTKQIQLWLLALPPPLAPLTAGLWGTWSWKVLPVMLPPAAASAGTSAAAASGSASTASSTCCTTCFLLLERCAQLLLSTITSAAAGVHSWLPAGNDAGAPSQPTSVSCQETPEGVCCIDGVPYHGLLCHGLPGMWPPGLSNPAAGSMRPPAAPGCWPCHGSSTCCCSGGVLTRRVAAGATVLDEYACCAAVGC